MFAMQIRNFFCLSQGYRVFADSHSHTCATNECVYMCVGLSVVVLSSDRYCSIKQTNFRYFSNNVPRIRARLASSAHCKLPVGTRSPPSSWHCCCSGGRGVADKVVNSGREGSCIQFTELSAKVEAFLIKACWQWTIKGFQSVAFTFVWFLFCFHSLSSSSVCAPPVPALFCLNANGQYKIGALAKT